MARDAARNLMTPSRWLLAALIICTLSLPGTSRASETIDAEIDRHTAKIAKLNQKKRPISWAMTHLRLGRVLTQKGRRDNDLAILDQALVAFSQTAALWSEERTPKKWSMVQFEKARVYEYRARITDYESNMEQALKLVETALGKRPQDAKDHKRARLELYQARIMINIGIDRLTGDALVSAGHEISTRVFNRYEPNPKSHDWNSVLIAHADATRSLAIIKRSTEHMQQAIDLYLQAENNARNTRADSQLNYARYQRGRALAALSWMETDSALALEASALFNLARPYYQKRGNTARLAFLDAAQAFSHILLATESPNTYSAKESLDRLINAEKLLRQLNRIPSADEVASDIIQARRIVQKLGHW